jgi:hypothetical protein
LLGFANDISQDMKKYCSRLTPHGLWPKRIFYIRLALLSLLHWKSPSMILITLIIFSFSFRQLFIYIMTVNCHGTRLACMINRISYEKYELLLTHTCPITCIKRENRVLHVLLFYIDVRDKSHAMYLSLYRLGKSCIGI